MKTTSQLTNSIKDPHQDSRARRSVAKSEWVKIYRGIYSDDITTPIEYQIRSNIIPIVKHLFPNSMISYRFAANLILSILVIRVHLSLDIY